MRPSVFQTMSTRKCGVAICDSDKENNGSNSVCMVKRVHMYIHMHVRTYMYIRVAACLAVSGHAEIKIRAKVIVLAVSSIRVVPCQPFRASHAVPSVETPHIRASVLRAMPCWHGPY